MKNTYVIPIGAFEEFKNKATRLGDKATKYGGSLVVEYGEPETFEGKLRGEAFNYIGVKVTIDDDAVVKKDGWEVIASIDIMKNGNVVSPFKGETAPEWRSIGCFCDHCGTNRARKRMYVVRKDGKELHVGSSCLKDYTGISPSSLAASMELHEIGGSYAEVIPEVSRAFETKNILATAIEVYSRHGYVKSGLPGSNKERVMHLVHKKVEPSQESREKAEKMIEEIISMDQEIARRALLEDAKTLLQETHLQDKYFGWMAHIPAAYAEYKRGQESASSYVGNEGDSITFTVKDSRAVSSYTNYYGESFIYIIVDDSGNHYKWVTKNSIPEKGSRIKATVKGHAEYNGVLQTVITRCKKI